MTTPIGTHIRKVLETVRNAVVEFCLVGVCLGIRLCDTFGDHLGITLLVASVVAVRTLHASSILEKFSAKRAAHDIVELLLGEFVAILFDDLFFALADSALAAETHVEWSLVTRVLDCCFIRFVVPRTAIIDLPKDIVR